MPKYSVLDDEYEIINNALYRHEYISESIVKRTLVITKDEFILCYETWIKKCKSEDKDE